MDGVSSITLASSLSIGVLFSAVPLQIYQGETTLLADGFGHSNTCKKEIENFQQAPDITIRIFFDFSE